MRQLVPQNLNANPAASQLNGLNWTQWLGRNLSGVRGTARRGSASVTMVLIIQWSDLATWIAGVLGYSYTSAPSGGRLHRVLPMQHPQLSWLFASEVAFEPLGFGAATRFGNAQSSGGTIQYGNDSGVNAGPWPMFDYGKLTITFTMPLYNIIPDSSIEVGDPVLGEQTRFVEKRCVGSVDIVQRQNGSMIFDPGATNGSVHNKPVTFGPGFPLVKKRHTFVWKDVPDAGLYSDGGSDVGGQPAMLDGALGCVNLDEVFGMATGTLLFDGYELIPSAMPVTSTLLNILQLGGDINYPRSYDVRLNFLELLLSSYQLGATSTTDPAGHAPNGHNCKPSPADNKFYILFDTGTVATILDYVDFGDIFKMN